MEVHILEHDPQHCTLEEHEQQQRERRDMCLQAFEHNELEASDYVLLNLFSHAHFALVWIDLRNDDCPIFYYDSLTLNGTDRLLSEFHLKWTAFYSGIFPNSQKRFRRPRRVNGPQQRNNVDCGAFVSYFGCLAAEQLTEGTFNETMSGNSDKVISKQKSWRMRMMLAAMLLSPDQSVIAFPNGRATITPF